MKHYATGDHQADTASFEGRSYDCACGFSSPDKNERDQHVRDEALEAKREADYDWRNQLMGSWEVDEQTESQ